MKLLVTVLLLANLSLAQGKGDLSGIFLRTQRSFRGQSEPASPRILDIKQTAEEVVVTATQNGETAIAHYLLGKKLEAVQARLKGENLVLKGTVKREWPGLGIGLGLGLPLTTVEKIEEKWELSPDSQQLVIRTKENIGAGESAFDIRYIREPSLEAAQVAADLAAKKDCESTLPISALRSQKERTRKYDQGAKLGMARLERITRCVSYGAILSGDFFKNLERTEKSGQAKFHKNGQTVIAYAGEVVLEIGLHHSFCWAEIGDWVATGPPSPEAAQDLRFKVRWLGEQQKDLGEVQSEFLVEPWREQMEPDAFYRMQIPAQDIPLTADLEVQILSKSGEQLACVKQHI
ncbi:MAG: hypothetical protein WCA27_12060 [Candidatus Sulfotelmatobacter sp.]